MEVQLTPSPRCAFSVEVGVMIGLRVVPPHTNWPITTPSFTEIDISVESTASRWSGDHLDGRFQGIAGGREEPRAMIAKAM